MCANINRQTHAHRSISPNHLRSRSLVSADDPAGPERGRNQDDGNDRPDADRFEPRKDRGRKERGMKIGEPTRREAKCEERPNAKGMENLAWRCLYGVKILQVRIMAAFVLMASASWCLSNT